MFSTDYRTLQIPSLPAISNLAALKKHVISSDATSKTRRSCQPL